MPAPNPTVVQVVPSSSTKGDSVSNNGFIYFNPPQPIKPGNSVIVFFEHASSVAGNISNYACEDDQGNVYGGKQGGIDSGNDQAVGGFRTFAVPTAVNQVRLQNKSGGFLNFWKAVLLEVNDLVADDVSNNGQANSATVDGGSLAVTQDGDFVLLYGARTSTVATTGFTPKKQANIDWSLVSADINDGDFLMAGVYNSTAALTPQCDMGTSTDFASLSMAFKTGNSGSPRDPTAVHFYGVHHYGFLTGTFGDPIKLQIPCRGDLLVIVRSGGVAGVGVIASILDTKQNDWKVGPATFNDASIQRAYALKPVGGNDLIVTVNQSGGASGDHTYMVYDVKAPDGYRFRLEGDNTNTGTQGSAGNLLSVALKPYSAFGAAFGAVSWAHGTANGLVDPRTKLDSIIFDGEPVDGPTNLDENNGFAHAIPTDKSALLFNWTKTGASPAAAGWESLAVTFGLVPITDDQLGSGFVLGSPYSLVGDAMLGAPDFIPGQSGENGGGFVLGSPYSLMGDAMIGAPDFVPGQSEDNGGGLVLGSPFSFIGESMMGAKDFIPAATAGPGLVLGSEFSFIGEAAMGAPDLQGTGLAGVAAGIASATGELTTAIPLLGAAVAQASASGSLSTAIPLAGAAAAIVSASGDLTAKIQLAGAAIATALAAGDLATAIQLAGNAQAAAAVTGDLGTAIRLQGNAAAVATATGDLTAPTGGLSGAAAAVASATGDLTIQILMNGAAVAQALAQGDLSTAIKLAGDASGRASATGNLGTGINLAGAATAQAVAQGGLSTSIQLAGVAASVVSATGALSTSIRLSAAAVAQVLAAGSLSVQIKLNAAAVAQAAASGDLGDFVPVLAIDLRYVARARPRNFLAETARRFVARAKKRDFTARVH